MKTKISNNIKLVMSIGLSLFIVSFIFSFTNFIQIPKISIDWDQPKKTHEYIPSYLAQSQFELVMVYIGSSTCGYSNTKHLPKILNEIKLSLDYKADSLNYAFSTIGISKDFNTEAGLKHLSKNGKFSEIITGKSWNSLGTMRYIWDKLPGVPATPQILVTLRKYENILNNNEEKYRGLLYEKVLVRKIGLQEIEDWQRLDIPIPNNIETL